MPPPHRPHQLAMQVPSPGDASRSSSITNFAHLPNCATPHVAGSGSIGSGASVGAPSVAPSVAILVERFVDNRRRRQHTIDAHFDEVEDALAEGDPVKFAFWSLDQDQTFFEDGGPAPKMLEVLGREIGLTAEQMMKLNAHRPAIRQDRETLARCQSLMRQAREDIHAHIQRSGDIMEHIRRILSPVQVAKFFVWVEKHQNSVKTLTTLWDSSCEQDCPEESRDKGDSDRHSCELDSSGDSGACGQSKADHVGHRGGNSHEDSHDTDDVMARAGMDTAKNAIVDGKP